jgi:outer membrane protein assembly factor BamB
MVAALPLIDLDRPPPAEPPSRPPVRPALLVALIAVLLTLGGAAPPRPGLTPVLTVAGPVTAFELAAGSFFLATTTEVRGYDLPPGAPRWTRAFDRNVQVLRHDGTTGVLLTVSGLRPRLTALDARTGRELWIDDAPGTVVIGTSGGAVLTRTFDDDGARLRLADVRTGREIWTREVDPAGFFGPEELYTGGSSRIVAVGSSGEVVVLRYADGAVLARGDLGSGPERGAVRPAIANAVAISVVGERLYLSRRLRGQTTLTAYSVESLARLWRAEGGPVGTVTDCGPVLCVTDTRWVSAVDPAGGAVRWAQPAWGIAYRYDAGLLFAYDNQEKTGAALLDAASGRVVRPLGASRQTGELILRAEGRRTLVLVPDEGAPGGLRTAGVMHDAAWSRCAAGAGYLLCPTITGDTALWRVHRLTRP